MSVLSNDVHSFWMALAVSAGDCRWAIIFWNSVPITVSMLVDAQSGKSVSPLLR